MNIMNKYILSLLLLFMIFDVCAQPIQRRRNREARQTLEILTADLENLSKIDRENLCWFLMSKPHRIPYGSTHEILYARVARNLRLLPQQVEESTEDLNADLKELSEYSDCKGVLAESEFAKELAAERARIALKRKELDEQRRIFENEKAEFEALTAEQKKLEEENKALVRDQRKLKQEQTAWNKQHQVKKNEPKTEDKVKPETKTEEGDKKHNEENEMKNNPKNEGEQKNEQEVPLKEDVEKKEKQTEPTPKKDGG